MITKVITGSDIIEKTGWNEQTMLMLFDEFIIKNNLEDSFLEYLNNVADEELKECDSE